MKKISRSKKPLCQWARAALAGCDWFVNSQLLQRRPNWDANHGRFCYNVHIKSGQTVLGLSWTQGRAVMCLLTAYERTGDQKYLESARLGVNYIKLLQNMDSRFPLTYGAIHEETPHSRFSYPRDAIEAVDGLLQWYVFTGDRDALYRADLFFKWFKRNAFKTYPGFGFWVKGAVHFDDAPSNGTRFKKPISCEMGCGTIFAHAYSLTRNPEYKRAALQIADSIIRNYQPNGTGPLREAASKAMSHHTSTDGVIYNDDGGTVSLLNAYKLTKKRKYLNAAIQVAEFYLSLRSPVPIFSGQGSIANILLEVDRATGQDTYRAAAVSYAKKLLKLQVKSGDKLVKGAFRGEDEGGQWYYPGAANTDLVTTRVTAYSVLALFKLDGVAWPRGYSTRF